MNKDEIIEIEVCPNCGSTNLGTAKLPNDPLDWKCTECGEIFTDAPIKKFVTLKYHKEALSIAEKREKELKRQISLYKNRCERFGIKRRTGGLNRGVVGKERAIKFEQKVNNELRREIQSLKDAISSSEREHCENYGIITNKPCGKCKSCIIHSKLKARNHAH